MGGGEWTKTRARVSRRAYESIRAQRSNSNTRDDLFNTKVRPQTPLAAAGSRDAPLFAARRRRSPLKLPVVVPIRDDADDGILV